MPEHYDPELTPRWRRLTGLAAWIAVAVGALVLDAARRYLSADAPRWRTLAHVVAVAVVVGGAYRAAGAMVGRWTVGPSHAAAAGVEAPAESGRLQLAPPTIEGDDAATADGYGATPTADPRLQPTPGGGLPMLEHAAPGGPDSGERPTWLPDGLAAWWPDIVAAAHEHGLDSHAWGAIVAIECPWGDPNCGSPAGARGLAQIMAGTAADIEAKSGLPCTTQPFDGPTSLRCGASHFAELVRMNADLWTPGDDMATLLAAAASYNSGAGAQPRQAVRRAAQSGGDLCAGVAFAETLNYCVRYREMWQATVAERTTNDTAALPPVEVTR